MKWNMKSTMLCCFVKPCQRQMAIDRAGAESGVPRPPRTRVITLEHAAHNDSTLYRFEKGCYLQFCPGPSLFGRKVFLYTNYVMSDNQEDNNSEQAEFVRNQYYGLEWRRAAAGADAGAASLGAGVLVDDTDLYCELKLARAGSFHYYFVYDNAESPIGPQGSGWFQVPPTLRTGAADAELPLDALLCHTVLAKALGPLPRWERVLRVSKEAGYNMIHFTPVQELGASNSSYSIANQLRLNPKFDSDGREATFADVENLVSKMRNEWKMLSICDIVLNHTANEAPWLARHPEASYNCGNSAHLRPAALLDAALAALGAAAARGDLVPRGVPSRVSHHDHIEAIRHLLETQLVPEARLHEMYICNTQDIVHEFYYMAKNKVPPVKTSTESDRGELKLIQDPQFRRLKSTVDLDLALQIYNVYRNDCYDEESRLKKCCEELKRKLEQLNDAAAEELGEHLRAAIDNCVAGMRYFRLQSDGPKIEEISEKNPLVPRYFTWGAAIRVETSSLAEVEAALFGDQGQLVMAHNGWVMNADPLQDFASKEHNGRVYLRRELIAWGDSVKLRYGDRPEDSVFLWSHMRQYVELTAEVFDGVRLDNCHSTPLHVAEYMLDCARNVKPDLYVVAELFTNSDQVDNIFVNRLGITSLIREAQSAWDSHEQGRLVHRFGGRPVGSFIRPPRRAAAPRVAHAMLLDLTHDNPSPLDKRSVFDMLPSAALVAMACCATGSTRGYDELVPHHIHVVDEARLYAEWGAADEDEPRAGAGVGILAAKRVLNDLHAELARTGYSEVYVDQMDADVVAVTRHNPKSRKSVILVAFTAFNAPDPADNGRYVKPLKFEGELEEILFEADLTHVDHKKTGRPLQPPAAHTRHPRIINGLSEYSLNLHRRVALSSSTVFSASRRDGPHTVLEFRPLRPGTVVCLRLHHNQHATALGQLSRQIELVHAQRPDALGLEPQLSQLGLGALGALLHRCDAEERAARGAGVYDVPGLGPAVYAGLQGVASILSEVRPSDDLGHPLCDNLRAGDWLLDYQWQRLERDPNLAPIASRIREILRPLSEIPRFLVPAYADALLMALYDEVTKVALSKLGAPGRGGSFSRALALTSVQLTAAPTHAALPPLSPALAPPRPSNVSSLSAGLPHFATGYMRCWGRDTFIALKGIFLLTERYQDARYHILGFGACLRHGLIPNLLDGGHNARFNCRDAVWWWLQSIKEYCTLVPQGHAILSDPVSRLFPKDDSEPAPPGAVDQPLHDVMQEALDVHFQGLVFRERNAGRAIDAHMSDKGFNIQIGVDPETGFPFGGNDANCGTWMDKMGSSEPAGTRGKPATPRDGSAVELVGLAHSAVSWLAAQHRAGRYPYPGVVRRHRDGSLTSWTYSQWADKIRANFERYFWIPPAPSAADARPDLVHRRGIYKDSHGASRPWADYQLRCNFPIAMAVAPELFDPKKAWAALDIVEKLLLGPLGVKTLDPEDWAYRGDYDNSNSSDDPNVAHGFNYHQGPEWVWPIGFYLRARLNFAHEVGRYARTVAAVYGALGPLCAEIRSSPWRGLPELTNANGAYCRDSCRTQAWSSALVLEVLRHAPRAPSPRRLYAEVYSAPPRPPRPHRQRLPCLARLLRRRPAPERLARTIYNFLQSRSGSLATVVYSDRYFKYGLPLDAIPVPSRKFDAFVQMNKTTHYIPLRNPIPKLSPGAGVLRDADARTVYRSPRYAPLRRIRRDVPQLFALSSDARFEMREFEREGWRRPLEYRRPRDGFPPFAFYKDPPRASLQRCVSRSSLTSIISTEARIPQFALDEYMEIDIKSDSGSIRKRRSSTVSYKDNKDENKENVVQTAKSGFLERKILNTERYNNGAQAPLLGRARRSSLGRGPRSSTRNAQRATIRAVLASSALFYALALISFYFLSLA
ncbi:glycogen debranching enzyme isoform X2 [Plodia interpunctella]|uniref:glycogen debranching enzyme isoform X2 n=1 Tax=Plodia interpunctella TaxID=58824 RepID=UPI0023676A2D|nr:glycogen debranching enzyme isoform X2 [Plodia interpunctella]